MRVPSRAAAAAVFGSLLALALSETLVRLTVRDVADLVPATVKAGEPHPVRLYEAHPFLPYKLRPGLRVWLVPGRGSGRRIEYRINSFGGRGDEPLVPKPPGLVRIAALGGSTTFSIFNSEEESWPKVLERRLDADAAPGTRYEVLHFGMPKASSPYSLVVLATRVIQLRPDVVIVYHGINDVSAWRFPGLLPDHSHVYADLRPVPAWVERVPAWAFRSALVTFGVQRLALRLEDNFGERPDLARPGAPDVPHGVAILLDHYRSMRGICEAHGARFMSATFHVLREDDAWGRAVAALNDALRRFGREERVPVADLAARLPHADRRLHADGAHFTPRGDALAAQVFEQTLRTEVLPAVLDARRRGAAGGAER